MGDKMMMTIKKLDYKELDPVLNDSESSAVLLFDDKSNDRSLNEFGLNCLPYVAPLMKETLTCDGVAVSEEKFWESCLCVIKNIKDITDIEQGKIIAVLSFWDDWNDKFFVVETSNSYYGISWFTSA